MRLSTFTTESFHQHALYKSFTRFAVAVASTRNPTSIKTDKEEQNIQFICILGNKTHNSFVDKLYTKSSIF